MTRTNAHLLGSAFATIPAGATREVLCLVPWVPVIVNDGHECVVVVANHPGDPLPTPPPDAFDPPAYRQVAQRNLTVLVASSKTMMLRLAVGGLLRRRKTVLLVAEVGAELERETLALLGLGDVRHAKEHVSEIGLSPRRDCVADDEPIGEPRVEVDVAPGTSAGIALGIRNRGLEPGQYEVVTVREEQGGGAWWLERCRRRAH